MFKESIPTKVKSYKIIKNHSRFIEEIVAFNKKELLPGEKSKVKLVCRTYDMVMGKEEKKNRRY